VLAPALLAAALLPPHYRATAVLAVLPSPEYTVRAAAGSHDANASALALDQIMKTETEILGSDDLHLATLRDVGPGSLYPSVFAPEPRGLLRRALHGLAVVLLSPWRTSPPNDAAARDEAGLRRCRSDLVVLPAKDANVITVTFDSRSGQLAARAVNTMLGLYAVTRTRLYDDPQLEIVRREAADGARAVSEADRRLADFKHDHAISDYQSERDLLLRRRSQAEQAADDAEASVGEYEARLAALTHSLRAEPATIGVFDEKDGDARLLAVNAALQDVRAKLAAAREKYKDTSRMIGALRAQLASNEAEASRLSHDPTASVVRQGRNPSIDPLRLDRDRAQAELAASSARLAAERAQIREIALSLDRLDGEEAALSGLERAKAGAEQNFHDASRILAERHLSEAEDARRLANVRVIQPASVPQTPRALPLLIAAAGVVLGGLAAVGWIVGRFVLKPVFLTGPGLEAATGLPVLAVFTREASRQAPADQLLPV
jgi:uncharacterized protein involved in exopolysaccharide biosynthesis